MTLQLINDIQRCATLFRLGRDIEAALTMVDLIDSVISLSGGYPAEEQARGMQLLNAILQCQERQDWIGLADWLEYELVAFVSMRGA